MRPEDTEMIANICSFERMEAAINEFQPFKAPGLDGLYPLLLQKDWNQPKGHYYQRWSPQGHILKSLALKVKSLALASRPQVLENWPVLGSRTAVFFELLKFC